MIAQGEFWELLNAKTDERTAILRTIFETSAYKNLEYKLKDRKNGNYAQMVDTQNSVIQYFNDVFSGEDSSFKETLFEMQSNASKSKSAWNIADFLAITQDITAEDTALLGTIDSSLAIEEQKLEDKKKVLATASTNNDFLDRLASLQAQKTELLSKKDSIEELRKLQLKRKNAVYAVKPGFDLWTKKNSEAEASAKDIQVRESHLSELRTIANNSQKAFEKALSEKTEIDRLKGEIARLKEKEPLYEKRDVLVNELSRLLQKEKEIQHEEKSISEAENALEFEINQYNVRIGALEISTKELVEVSEKLFRLENLEKQILKQIDEQIPAVNLKHEDYISKQKIYKDAYAIYHRDKEAEERAKTIIESCRAGILASELSEGMPCPVCGSTHHLKYAVLPEEYVTEEEYKALQESLRVSEAKKNEALTSCETAKEMFEAFYGQVIKDIKECLENDIYASNISFKTFEDLQNLIVEEQKVISEQLLKFRAKKNLLSDQEVELKALRNKLLVAQNETKSALEKRKINMLDEKQSIVSKIAAKNAEIAAIKELAYDSLAKARAARENFEKEANCLEADIEAKRRELEKSRDNLNGTEQSINTLRETYAKQSEDAKSLYEDYKKLLSGKSFASEQEFLSCCVSEEILQKDDSQIQNYEIALSTLEAKLSTATTDAQGKTYVDVTELSKQVQLQNSVVSEIREKQNKTRNRIANNTEKYNNIQKQRAALEAYVKENDIYSKLYNLITGQTGEGKITFEQYIQAAGFDHIIKAANRRLLPMTDGQYELRRKDSALGKQSNTFLDLEVIDNYTGHRRPVGNLSGGESFKASLSLALGLSDTVSSNLGGVQMDALFVDEGFGTLDHKSIENAMDILTNLAGTNKLVGIISHREELMQSIQEQIKVTKTRNGSTMSFEGIL